MKVAIGYNIQDGPWGGGNAFAKSFDELVADIDNHSQIKSVENERRAVFEEGKAKTRGAALRIHC